jgi:hypothetical protein
MASPTNNPESTANFDEDLIGEAAVAIPTALMPGAVKEYYNDQSKLKPKLKMAYIILQMTDLENKEITNKHNNATTSDEPTKAPPLFVPRSFMEATEPFATIYSQKNKPKKLSTFVLAKKEIAEEIKRRCPRDKGMNHNNNNVEQLMSELLKSPITDSGDIDFIKAEFQNIRCCAPTDTPDKLKFVAGVRWYLRRFNL